VGVDAAFWAEYAPKMELIASSAILGPPAGLFYARKKPSRACPADRRGRQRAALVNKRIMARKSLRGPWLRQTAPRLGRHSVPEAESRTEGQQQREAA
jgi:hypothetical protein